MIMSAGAGCYGVSFWAADSNAVEGILPQFLLEHLSLTRSYQLVYWLFISNFTIKMSFFGGGGSNEE